VRSTSYLGEAPSIARAALNLITNAHCGVVANGLLQRGARDLIEAKQDQALRRQITSQTDIIAKSGSVCAAVCVLCGSERTSRSFVGTTSLTLIKPRHCSFRSQRKP
jgi:hypothetical protein